MPDEIMQTKFTFRCKHKAYVPATKMYKPLHSRGYVCVRIGDARERPG